MSIYIPFSQNNFIPFKVLINYECRKKSSFFTYLDGLNICFRWLTTGNKYNNNGLTISNQYQLYGSITP